MSSCRKSKSFGFPVQGMKSVPLFFPTYLTRTEGLPPLRTSCITPVRNPLPSAQEAHIFHTSLWLDSSPESQVGLGGKRQYCSCPEDLMDSKQLDRTSGSFHPALCLWGEQQLNPTDDEKFSWLTRIPYVYCCQDWKYIRLSVYREVNQIGPLLCLFVALLLYDNSDDNPSQHLYFALCF